MGAHDAVLALLDWLPEDVAPGLRSESARVGPRAQFPELSPSPSYSYPGDGSSMMRAILTTLIVGLTIEGERKAEREEHETGARVPRGSLRARRVHRAAAGPH